MKAAAATLGRLPRVALALPPRARRRFAALLVVALVVLSAYRLWFRDSSFVSVKHVTVTGLTTRDAARIRGVLTAAARDMTTLDVQRSALEGAVAGFPIVKEIEATPRFPHSLSIHVVENRPVATLAVEGRRLSLAPDGSVLRGVSPSAPVPLIRGSGSAPQDMLTRGTALAALRAVAAAPAPLLHRIASAAFGKDGLYLRLRSGPRLVFGDDTRLAAKWAAAAAVLADPSSKGASYVDVRLPGRPVAGGLAAPSLAPITIQGNDASAQSNATGTTGQTGPSAGGQLPAANPQPSPSP